jgi:hypothetical protein
MRRFASSGWRRYALAFVVVGASLGVMGAQCAPTKEPVKEPPPTNPPPPEQPHGSATFTFVNLAPAWTKSSLSRTGSRRSRSTRSAPRVVRARTVHTAAPAVRLRPPSS